MRNAVKTFFANLVLGKIEPKELMTKIQHQFEDQVSSLMIRGLGETEALEKISKMLLNVWNHIESIFVPLFDEHVHSTKDAHCSFHSESVLEHSVFCMLLCLGQTGNYKDGVLGLFHDIGKRQTQTISRLPTGKFTSFYGHGIVGCTMMQKLWSDASNILIYYFTFEEWEDMCSVVNVHMCGYKYTELNSESIQKWNAFRLENDKVHHMLRTLSLADKYATICESDIEVPQFNMFNCTRQLFFDEITKPFDSLTFSRLCYGKGTLITVGGHSDENRLQLINDHLLLTLHNIGISEEQIVVIYRKSGGDNSYKNQIKEQIKSALIDNKIVIIDAKSNMYDGRAGSLPTNELFDGHNIMQEALKISILLADVPLNVTNCNDLKAMRSVFASNTMYRDINKNNHYPHFVHTVIGEYGLSRMLRHFEQLASFIISDLDIVNTDKMEIDELVSYLFTRYHGDLTAVQEWFKIKNFKLNLVYKEFERLFVVSYIDGCSYLWNAKWHRHARGTVLFLEYVNNHIRIRPIVTKLQRGAEMLTSTHRQKGIDETQDVDSISQHKFDENQLFTMDALSKDGIPLDATLTMKTDGSLACITLLDQSDPVVDVILEYGDNFSKEFVRLCVTNNLPYVIVVSSQNTLSLGPRMQPYFITTCSSIMPKGFESVRSFAKEYPEDECYRFLTHLFPYLVDRLNKLYHLYNGTRMTVAFETVVANRVDAWGNIHHELAMSYDSDLFVFLGVSTTVDEYIPHFVIPDEMKDGFVEPRYWHYNNSDQINFALDRLNDVLNGTITSTEFLITCKATGGSDLQLLDFEGFVIFTKIDGKYDYGKIKTPFYYIGHKFRPHNLDQILSASDVSKNVFPMIKQVTELWDTVPEIYQDAVSRYRSNIDHTLDSNAASSSDNPTCYREALGPKINGMNKIQNSAAKRQFISRSSPDLFHDVLESSFKNRGHVFPKFADLTKQKSLRSSYLDPVLSKKDVHSDNFHPYKIRVPDNAKRALVTVVVDTTMAIK